MFAGDNGGFAEYLENAKGDTVKVRAGDGVHFDTAGGDIIAREVLKQLNKLFDLTSWRKQKRRVTAYVALLRAVNVGGRNRLPMAELREALAGGGLDDVSTVLQSGNVLFRSGRRRRPPAKLVRDDDRATSFGLDTASSCARRGARGASPRRTRSSPAARTRDPKTLHVAFLAKAPAKAAARRSTPTARRPMRSSSRPRGVPQLPERLRPLAADARLPRAGARRRGHGAQLAHGAAARRAHLIVSVRPPE